MTRVLAIVLAALWVPPAAAQAVMPVVYRCFVEGGAAKTIPPSPLTLTQFTLHWRPATGDEPPTLKVLHEYFSNAPLTPATRGGTTIAGSYAGEDSKGRPRAATMTSAAQDDSVVGITLVEPFDLIGRTARFEVTAGCTRQ